MNKTRVSEGHGNGLVLVHERPQRGNLGTRLKVDAQQMPELRRILGVLASHEVDDDVVGGLAAVLRKTPYGSVDVTSIGGAREELTPGQED